MIVQVKNLVDFFPDLDKYHLKDKKDKKINTAYVNQENKNKIEAEKDK